MSKPFSPAGMRLSHRVTRAHLAILGTWVSGRDGIRYVRPASGTTALLRYDSPIGSYEFCTRLRWSGPAFCSPPARRSASSTPCASASPTTPGPCAPGLRLVAAFLDHLARP
ncbi:hypothetical protein [Streptomyces monashensis]|uniref:Uncharacterized protein n=1 Tax=Streptomyces monashensis TaxID=1678012 RepID=A0A1S2QE09_9ACTN|nr:hypothetical protein [Streptomyces monashensis]OIK03736.1 hypothetical protein BIV23_21045 [Streptomyces monashensis]